MELVKMDIDQILEATSVLLEEDYHFYNLKKIEIDKLLEKTQDWELEKI